MARRARRWNTARRGWVAMLARWTMNARRARTATRKRRVRRARKPWRAKMVRRARHGETKQRKDAEALNTNRNTQHK